MNTEVIATDVAGLSAFEYIGKAVADPTQLTNDKLSELSSAREALNAAFDKIDGEITRRIEEGQQVPGYALRPGRGSRVWNADEEEIAKALKGRRMKKDQIYPAKLITPAALEKLDCLTKEQKEKLLGKFVTEKAGKLKLTKVAHSEPSQEMFKDVAQCDTNDVNSAEAMFAGVAKPEPAKSLFDDTHDEVSFF